MKPFQLLFLSFLATVRAQAVFNPKNIGTSYNGTNPSFPVDISSLYNNRGFAIKANDSNFDGEGSGYPADSLPPSNFIYNGINFTFPTYKNSGNDNVLALGQTVQVPEGRYLSVHMMASCENGLASGFINATYSDNSTSSSPVLVPAWYSWPYPAGGDIILPYYYTNETANFNRSMFYQSINWIDSTKELVSLTLPNVTEGSNSGPGGAAIQTRLHIFSLSMLPASGSSIDLEIQFARTTQLWLPGTNKTQIIEVIINNVGSEWVLAKNTVKVEISSSGLETIAPGYINRLRPGDQAKVQVGVVSAAGVLAGTTGNATVIVSGTGVSTSYTFNATFGIAPYGATYESIYSHETPSWYDGAKYGIFIHWVGPSQVRAVTQPFLLPFWVRWNFK
jgi:alpha-L-fucosidase